MNQDNIAAHFQHVVCGGGLVGILWALYLKRMSNSVAVFESYNDLRQELIPGGRSINLVLSRKALDALQQLGIKQRILQYTIPIHGQIIHSSNGCTMNLPYGISQNDFTYEIPRNKLSECLLDIADCSDVQIYYQCSLVDGDVDKNQYIFNTFDPNGNEVFVKIKANYMYGCDGAGSKVRELILKKTNQETNVEWFDADYKQLFLPVNFETKNYYYDPNWVHIWPRGGHMMMGHANVQGSFSLTIILPSTGPFSFEQIGRSQQKIMKYFEEYYPELADKIPNLPVQFSQNPVGNIGTIFNPVWHYKGKVILLGDAAHTITPFLWQAVNVGMDDCLRLNKIVNQYGFNEFAFNQYFKLQKPKADALAELTVGNFQVISSLTNQPAYLNLKIIQKQIQRRYPTLFYSKYRLLYFEDKPYNEIQTLNEKYQRILKEINQKRISLENLGQMLIERMITQ